MLSVALFCLVGSAFALPQTQQIEQRYLELPEEQWTQPETPEAGFLGLPSGASLVVPQIRVSFSCVGRKYGYYADVENNCQIYHVCEQSQTPTGESITHHYSLFCPNTTRFDQRQHTCLPLTHENLLPCEQSLLYYPATELRFSEVPVPVQQTELVQTEQRFEQIPVEQRQEVPTTLAPVKGPLVLTQTRINTPVAPVKSISRSESFQVVPQTNIPVVSQFQPIAPIRRVPFVPTFQRSVVQQVQSVQPVVPQVVQSQSNLVQPIVQRSELVQPIVQQRDVEPIGPEVVVSEPAGRNLDQAFQVLQGVLRLPQQLASAQGNVQSQPISSQSFVQQSGLVGSTVFQRNSQFSENIPQPISSQAIIPEPVVVSGRNQVLQSGVGQFYTSSGQFVPQPNVVTNIVSQPAVPFRSSQVLVPQPQVVPQVYRAQSVVSSYAIPQINTQLPRVAAQQVVPQNFVSQPVVSQPQVAQFGSGVFVSRSNIPQVAVKSVNNPVVSNLFRNVEPNVIRPAQNPNFE